MEEDVAVLPRARSMEAHARQRDFFQLQLNVRPFLDGGYDGYEVYHPG